MAEQALSPKQKRALAALLTVGTVERASQISHLSKRSIFRYLKDPVFRAGLDEAADNALDEATRMLASSAGNAVLALRAALSEPMVKTADRTRAANAILARLMQLKELNELQARVQKLEEIVNAERHIK